MRNPPRLPRPRFPALLRGTLLFALSLLFLPAVSASADETFPAPDFSPAPSPDANPLAPKGGTLTTQLGPYPKSLNYYLDLNTMSAEVFSMLFEPLLVQNDETLAHEPWLADRWTVSSDGMEFTFRLSDKARWSDGTPVTAEDVAWTYEAVMAPDSLTGPHKISLGRFDPPEILDPATIRFRARERHWENLLAVGGMAVLPKHAYAGGDFNLLNFSFPVVSGPYGIARLDDGVLLVLRRRADWWAADDPRVAGQFNFDFLRYRFFEDRSNAFDAFLRGDLDLFAVYTAHRWATQTDGKKFRRGWIVKKEVANRKPAGFQGIALNMRHPPLDDRRVRLALAKLFDRKRMNETLMANAYTLHRSYYEDLYETPPREPVAFDPAGAAALLREAGWTRNPATGALEKDDRRMKLSWLSRGSTDEKFIAVFREALSAQGIELAVDKKDWSAWAKDMDTYAFELTWCAWSGGRFKDPESMWFSEEGAREGGQNLCGFADARVDELVRAARTEESAAKRHEMVKEIDGILCREVPYILLWFAESTRLCFWNRFGMPEKPLGTYGDESAARRLWWHDPEAVRALAEAREKDRDLPPPFGAAP